MFYSWIKVNLLRAFRANNSIDNNLIQRWENFVLCYDIIYWDGFFYNKRKGFRGNFDTIYASLRTDLGFDECKKLLLSFYNGQKSFGSGWTHLGINTKNKFDNLRNKWLSATFGWTRAGYFLYKYEIQKGAIVEKIRVDIFKDDKVSIDHIVARGLSWHNLGFTNYEKLEEISEEKKQANELHKEIWSVINGIGNLALSTSSDNASDSNKLPVEHINTYEKCGFIETAKQVKSWVNPQEFKVKINERSENIINFISETVVNRVDIWK